MGRGQGCVGTGVRLMYVARGSRDENDVKCPL